MGLLKTILETFLSENVVPGESSRDLWNRTVKKDVAKVDRADRDSGKQDIIDEKTSLERV